MAKDNTLLYLGLGGVVLLVVTGGLSSFTNHTTSTTATTAVDNKTPIDAAGTVQADYVNGYANRQTELPNHPDLLDPNHVLTQAQRVQYIQNYLELQQAMPQWVQQNPQYNGSIYEAAQSHWTQYGCGFGWTYYALVPSNSTPYVPPKPPTTSNSGGSIWSGLLGVATSVLPAVLAGVGTSLPVLGDLEISILIPGCAFVKGILPFFADVEPGYVNIVNERIDVLVNHYGS